MRIQQLKCAEYGGTAYAAAALLWALPAAADTPAGTAIVNVARLAYIARGQPATTESNENRIVVAERLDVTLAGDAVATLPDGAIAAAAILTNTGNGGEAFAIGATATAGADRIVRVAIDGDGDGRYDPARDAALIDGRTPSLASGQRVTLFVVLSAATAGSVTVTAAATTGSGAPGTVFAGAGDGGGDAVTGATGARASVTIALDPGSGTGDAPTLTKSATIAAPDGTTRAVRGATITYTLVARFTAAAQGARLTDPIPVGTAYAPGSLTLDDGALTDAADADAGEVAAGRVAVTLGDQAAGAVRTIRFKVVIQ